LTAYIAGMEVAIRLCAAVKGGFYHAGFHATGIVSHFSAAVVAGKLLQLSVFARHSQFSRARQSTPAPSGHGATLQEIACEGGRSQAADPSLPVAIQMLGA
jgi:MmgE/PrpD N-terminal domain